MLHDIRVDMRDIEGHHIVAYECDPQFEVSVKRKHGFIVETRLNGYKLRKKGDKALFNLGHSALITFISRGYLYVFHQSTILYIIA
jgi:hypothetical protein